MAILFSVDDKHELLALHRALFSAKFAPEAPPEFTGSPFLAAMIERAADAVAQLAGGSPQSWIEWQQAESYPEELAIVRRRLSECRAWPDWSPAQRLEFVRLLLSPFRDVDDTVQELLAYAEARHPVDSKPRFFIRSVLRGIQQRPQMYFGPTKHPFTSLCGFLNGHLDGYGTARPGIGRDELKGAGFVPYEFHQFVAEHFGEAADTGGWRHCIIHHTQDEQAAFDLFFELLAAYERRSSAA